MPDGPHVADVLVPKKDLSDLLFGEHYGLLSATVQM